MGDVPLGDPKTWISELQKESYLIKLSIAELKELDFNRSKTFALKP